MKSKIDKSKSEFWDSDCFVEKELTRIWQLYHQEERESPDNQ